MSLVLSRLCGERIVTEGPVTITVAYARDGKVRLLFDGPGRVYRAELHREIRDHGARRPDLALR